MSINKRKFVFYTKWNKNDLVCACLFHNPCCKEHRQCEELEMELKPYDDIEEVMKNQRAYTRGKGGALKQK